MNRKDKQDLLYLNFLASADKAAAPLDMKVQSVLMGWAAATFFRSLTKEGMSWVGELCGGEPDVVNQLTPQMLWQTLAEKSTDETRDEFQQSGAGVVDHAMEGTYKVLLWALQQHGLDLSRHCNHARICGAKGGN